MEYYNAKLVRKLKQYQLYDAKVWVRNPEAVYNSKEMVEVQHNLISRRQKLRERIEYTTQSIEELRKEVEPYARTHSQMIPELQQILELLDK